MNEKILSKYRKNMLYFRKTALFIEIIEN